MISLFSTLIIDFKTFYRSLNFLFNVICVSNTWEDSNLPIEINSLFNLPCYDLVSQARLQKRGGETAIFILSSLSFQLKKQHCILTKNAECVFTYICVHLIPF